MSKVPNLTKNLINAAVKPQEEQINNWSKVMKISDRTLEGLDLVEDSIQLLDLNGANKQKLMENKDVILPILNTMTKDINSVQTQHAETLAMHANRTGKIYEKDAGEVTSIVMSYHNQANTITGVITESLTLVEKMITDQPLTKE